MAPDHTDGLAHHGIAKRQRPRVELPVSPLLPPPPTPAPNPRGDSNEGLGETASSVGTRVPAGELSLWAWTSWDGRTVPASVGPMCSGRRILLGQAALAKELPLHRLPSLCGRGEQFGFCSV